jgi:hypothetical protein
MVLCLWHWGTRPTQLAHYGDDQEYLTLTMSFVRHHSPEFRTGDDRAMLDALPLSWRRSLWRKFTPGAAPGAYYPSRTGEYYAFHFFTYPAAVAPVRAWLDGRPSASRAHQYFNLIALSIAFASLLLLASRPRVFWPITLLAFLTPVLWFTTYATTETFVFSLGLLAVVCQLLDRSLLAILFNSIAATQYQPLALLSLFLCGQWLWTQRASLRQRVPQVIGALASTAIVFVPGIFYYVHFGVPNLIAREGLASTKFMSVRKFVGLFIDLNGGMLLYTPGVLLFLSVATVWAIARARRRDPSGLLLLGSVLLIFAASTVQRNWNHPTFGVSRYALYGIAPSLMFIAGELRARVLDSRLLLGLCALALGLQVAVHRADGWFVYRSNDAVHHSRASSYVLEHWPWLYSPHSEIFCERTAEHCWPDPTNGETAAEHLPVLYRDAHWAVRKVLAARCDEAKLLAAAPWTRAERDHIHAVMQHCSGTGTLYINF